MGGLWEVYGTSMGPLQPTPPMPQRLCTSAFQGTIGGIDHFLQAPTKMQVCHKRQASTAQTSGFSQGNIRLLPGKADVPTEGASIFLTSRCYLVPCKIASSAKETRCFLATYSISHSFYFIDTASLGKKNKNDLEK